jgi:two-component system NtrC family response regulator
VRVPPRRGPRAPTAGLTGGKRVTSQKRKLLVIEDDPGLQKQLRWCFEDFDVVFADGREVALAQLRRHEPAVATVDLGLPPDADGTSEGFATLEQILVLAPETKVIVVTGNQDRENAVKAVGMGAYDFYPKPFDPQILGLIVQRAFHVRDLEEENRRLARAQASTPLQGVITGAERMLKVCRTVEKLAPTGVTTLLLGESGTGKELLARALHDLSERARKRFVAINCAAIPETLLESELFGYEKGAFTGAQRQTRGKIEYADGGTLFLDEVGDLPMSLQVKLLRFLQERVIERVGGRQEIPVDVRVVCATHQDLGSLMGEGRFREDLYYRISEVAIHIPPLRDREGDAVLLAHTFLERFNRDLGRSVKGLSEEAVAAIEQHTWPGNVRELENRIKRAVIMAEGSRITPVDLELEAEPADAVPFNLRQVREQAERRAVIRALNLYNRNISQVAEALGISRPTLYDLINKYGLK